MWERAGDERQRARDKGEKGKQEMGGRVREKETREGTKSQRQGKWEIRGEKRKKKKHKRWTESTPPPIFQ